jgi:serine/threonine protein kinase
MSAEGTSTNAVGAPPPLLNERFELGERLAEGTFFLVHRGRDTRTGKQVAVKILKPEYRTDEPFSELLLSEAQKAVQLTHPNVARVLDAFRERGTVVMVAEWIQGINLKDRIRRVAPFPLAVALDIYVACAEALKYAHGAGVLHGDLRPDNVLITPDGQVKLTGFGLGRSIHSSTRVQLDALPSSVYYMAPELTENHQLDERSDVYALGCLLFEMLAGAVPYDGDKPVSVAAKHAHQPVPSLRKANPAVPQAVDGIVQKSMQKGPDARYQDVDELLADVQSVREAMRENRSLNWSPARAAAEKAAVPKSTVPRHVSREELDEEEEDNGPSLKLLVGVALLAIVTVLLSVGAVTLLLRKPSQVPMPNVIGMPQAQAEDLVQKAGLRSELRQEYSLKPIGVVYDSHPKPNVDTLRGRSVTLWVSRGPQPISVPDVIGKPLGEAQSEIQAVGLVLKGTKEEFSEVVEKGKVISQEPVGGTEAAKKSPVELVVSKGPEPVKPAEEPVEIAPTGENTNPDGDAPPEGEPTSPDGDRAGTPTGDTHDYEISFTVPLTRVGTQTVRIVVRNQDGQEVIAYDREHQPGDVIDETVPVTGAKGKSQIRVYLNGVIIKRENV